MPDRRAEAVNEDGGTIESHSHPHAQRRYNWRLEDRHSQPQQMRLSIGLKDIISFSATTHSGETSKNQQGFQ
jgi:hypothetical protein